MEESSCAPFAITATTIGKPKFLYTKILIVNFDCDDKINATYVNALWDTGASTSVMTRALAEKLGIRFSAEAASRSVTGTEIAKYGYAYVSLVSNGGVVHTMTAIVESLPRKEYSFIIGMDVINRGSLAISSHEMRTYLSFTMPACAPVDFTQNADGKITETQPLNPGPEDGIVIRGMDAINLILKKNM